MSAVQGKFSSWWSLGQQLDEYTKYEKCRNITEEIYKRINMFEVKKSEFDERKSAESELSDNSDQIDSNELSNETDLFACDKSDITSSTEAERPPPPVVNINNNYEKNKPVHKRPRKRFRKRVKKRPPNRNRSDSEGSSDEAPLVRNNVILSPDLRPKLEKVPPKKPVNLQKNLMLRDLLKKEEEIKIPTVIIEKIRTIDNVEIVKEKQKPIDKEDGAAIDKKSNAKVTDWRSCTVCNLYFRGERGLRRHMSMTHISPESNK